jgi:outer membrane protein TolC
MMHLRPWVLASSALAFLLAGCTVGPNYHRPTAATAPAWKENTVPPPNPPNGTWKQAEPSDSALRGQWWDLYGDPQLSALEAKVAVSNQTLRAAMEQYFSAREQVRVARSQYPANM